MHESALEFLAETVEGKMTKNEFDLQMLRLKEAYGKHKYPGERRDIFWERFQKISEQSFSDEILNFIANSDRAPMAKEFEAALAGELSGIRSKERKRQKREESEGYHCKVCFGKGWFKKLESGSRDGTVATAWFRYIDQRCHCQEAHTLPLFEGETA